MGHGRRREATALTLRNAPDCGDALILAPIPTTGAADPGAALP